MTQATSVEPRASRSTPIISLLLLSGITLDIQYGILAPLIGVIATESGLTGSEIGWVLNALMMGSVISVSLTARMGDIFGHRKVLIGSSSWHWSDAHWVQLPTVSGPWSRAGSSWASRSRFH